MEAMVVVEVQSDLKRNYEESISRIKTFSPPPLSITLAFATRGSQVDSYASQYETHSCYGASRRSGAYCFVAQTARTNRARAIFNQKQDRVVSNSSVPIRLMAHNFSLGVRKRDTLP